jgi:hypothetical protein
MEIIRQRNIFRCRELARPTSYHVRSAGWQSAVSQVANLLAPDYTDARPGLRPADCQSAIQQVANLRYGRFMGSLDLRNRMRIGIMNAIGAPGTAPASWYSNF